LGEQVLGWTMEGSSTDQVRCSSKVPGLLRILINLFPSNNPSKSYLATRFRLLGEQVLGWTMEGSSTDQVRGSSKVPGLLGILTNLFPSNNPSKSYPLLVTHASWSI